MLLYKYHILCFLYPGSIPLPVQVTGLQRRRHPHLLEQLHLEASSTNHGFSHENHEILGGFRFQFSLHFFNRNAQKHKELKKWEASPKGELFVIQGLFFLGFLGFVWFHIQIPKKSYVDKFVVQREATIIPTI